MLSHHSCKYTNNLSIDDLPLEDLRHAVRGAVAGEQYCEDRSSDKEAYAIAHSHKVTRLMDLQRYILIAVYFQKPLVFRKPWDAALGEGRNL